MIFKTFNSDIDKISAKWGIFGKSFNELVEASNKRKIAIDDLFTINGLPLKDAKKQAGSFWSYLYPSKESIQSQMVDVESLYPNQTDAQLSTLLSNLQQHQQHIDATKDSWSDYFIDLSEGEKWQIEFVQNTDLQKASLDDIKGAYESARKAAIDNNQALQQQTLGYKAATAATKALAIASNMLLMWGISKVISLAATGITNLANSTENCKERVDELMSSYKSALDTANSNAETVENLADRYEELSKGVNSLGQNVSLTADEYAEYNEIVEQIADMFPTMIQGYTDEGTAILSLKGNVEELRDACKEAQPLLLRKLLFSLLLYQW